MGAALAVPAQETAHKKMNRAIRAHDLATVRQLLKEGVNPNGTFLFLASLEKDQPIVQLLLSKGANPNQRERHGFTAITAAVFEGNYRIAEMLLDHGADPNAPDKYQTTPIMSFRNYPLDKPRAQLP